MEKDPRNSRSELKVSKQLEFMLDTWVMSGWGFEVIFASSKHWWGLQSQTAVFRVGASVMVNQHMDAGFKH